jgi:hypothetical protein
MPTYSVHMFSDECSVPHPMGIAIQLNEELAPDQSIGDIYDGRELPASLAMLADNSIRCPKHKQADYPANQLPLFSHPDTLKIDP